MRPLREGTAEIKRLYVRPAARGQRLGEGLARAIVEAARGADYRQVVLGTLPGMRAAHALYEGRGFVPVAPYYDNPVEGTRYVGLDL